MTVTAGRPADLARRRGSWPALFALVAVFLAAFAWQRWRATFLRIEAGREAAVALAQPYGLTVAEVFALRELVGVEASNARWQEVVARYAAAGGGEGALAGLGDDAQLTARRFALLRARFAARDAAR